MLLLLLDVCKNLTSMIHQWKLQIYRDDGTMEWSAEHWFILAQKSWPEALDHGLKHAETVVLSSFFPSSIMGSYHSQTKWVERLMVGHEFGTLLTFQHFANCQFCLNFC
jgi:hypothetical protein